MGKLPQRVEWSEMRAVGDRMERFYIVAEKNEGCWSFYERSGWDVCWYSTEPDSGMLEKLDYELRNSAQSVGRRGRVV